MPAPNPKPLFAALRRIRLERGWTQEQLGERAGVDQATISYLEGGHIKNPSFDAITRIARALGVNPEDIMATARSRKAAGA